jgi:hypothetical protein
MPEAIVLRPRVAGPTAPFGSAAQLPAGWATPEVLVWCPWGAAPEASVEAAELPPAGWAMPEAIVSRLPAVALAEMEMEMEMAHSSAEAAPKVRRSAGPAVSAEQAAAVARDAEAVPLQAAAWVAAEEPQQEAAAQVGVEAAVLRQEAAVRQREARGAAGGLLLGAAPNVVQRRAALPSAAPLVFHRDRLRRRLARPAPQRAARFARAMMASFRTASL